MSASRQVSASPSVLAASDDGRGVDGAVHQDVPDAHPLEVVRAPGHVAMAIRASSAPQGWAPSTSPDRACLRRADRAGRPDRRTSCDARTRHRRQPDCNGKQIRLGHSGVGDASTRQDRTAAREDAAAPEADRLLAGLQGTTPPRDCHEDAQLDGTGRGGRRRAAVQRAVKPEHRGRRLAIREHPLHLALHRQHDLRARRDDGTG